MEAELVRYLQRLFPTPAGTPVPNGDDAAVVATASRTAITVDTQQEGVHFRWGWAPPARLGARLVGVVLSDLAAMGARPRCGVLSLLIPAGVSLRDVRGYLRGVAVRAASESFAIVGGDVSTAAGFGAVLTALGDAPRRPLLRAGGREGDLLCVSGPVGEAAWQLRQRLAGRKGRLDRWLRPPSRISLGMRLAADRRVHAAMDISDGLFLDAGRLAAASGLGLELSLEAVPLTAPLRRALRGAPLDLRLAAIGGGEDYELLAAVDPRYPVPAGLTPIGSLGGPRQILLVNGDPQPWPAAGWLHGRPAR